MNLSEREKEVLSDVDFILTKRKIFSKILSTLEEFKNELIQLTGNLEPNHLIRDYMDKYPKISRGENYGGLPYFILDYPRVFNKNESFAIRSMLLWGNFFSFTLHVSGDIKEKISKKVIANKNSYNDYFCCVNETPWEYHYNKDNYLLIRNLTQNELDEIINSKSFLKISLPYNLSDFANLKTRGFSFYQKIFSLLS